VAVRAEKLNNFIQGSTRYNAPILDLGQIKEPELSPGSSAPEATLPLRL
jgi:hypothetical protein